MDSCSEILALYGPNESEYAFCSDLHFDEIHDFPMI